MGFLLEHHTLVWLQVPAESVREQSLSANACCKLVSLTFQNEEEESFPEVQSVHHFICLVMLRGTGILICSAGSPSSQDPGATLGGRGGL